MACMCEWAGGCGGLGTVHCQGCGGDLCVCLCGGEMPCSGCEDCETAQDVLDETDPPYVCPGCHAVGGERCAPGCIDDEIAREHEEAMLIGDYDRMEDDDA